MQQEVNKDSFVVPVVGGVYEMQVNPSPFGNEPPRKIKVLVIALTKFFVIAIHLDDNSENEHAYSLQGVKFRPHVDKREQFVKQCIDLAISQGYIAISDNFIKMFGNIYDKLVEDVKSD